MTEKPTDRDGGSADGSYRTGKKQNNGDESPRLYLVFTINRTLGELKVYLLRAPSGAHAGARLQAGLDENEEVQLALPLTHELVAAMMELFKSDPGGDARGLVLARI